MRKFLKKTRKRYKITEAHFFWGGLRAKHSSEIWKTAFSINSKVPSAEIHSRHTFSCFKYLLNLSIQTLQLIIINQGISLLQLHHYNTSVYVNDIETSIREQRIYWQWTHVALQLQYAVLRRIIVSLCGKYTMSLLCWDKHYGCHRDPR